ncbi:hypothetical protein PIN31115_01046 [Pandoraea iniqua]|uniref:Major facilitator superfamily (MFS) profile domain-containing protein n=2 Tax=Pandoraea iniqua TaxID=2508288 RepID=A0A5E4T0W0_9BURK|nr:hypothetical protein PIN31115_01046 [Pandoraea iniqua]
MRGSYGKLIAIPGAAAFSAAALLGRLPTGMLCLSVIVPIVKFTGSYTTAGMVVASTMTGMALCAPLSGRLVDRHGQFLTLLVSGALNLGSISVLMACIHYRENLPLLCIVGGVAGATRLPTGAMARARWTYLARTFEPGQRSATLQLAYAFESVVDEIMFICAPIIATLLCTMIHPLAGLAGCLISYSVGAVALAMQRRTEPNIETVRVRHPSALKTHGFRILIFATFFIGISAGAVEVIVVARANAAGSQSLIGLLMASLALSSMLAGLWYGAQSFRQSAQSLWIRCLGLLVLALIPFAFAENLSILAIALFIAGLSIAPTSNAGQILVERTLHGRLLNEGMSIVTTSMMLGMAAGGWISGALIDRLGTHLAGALPATSTVAAFAIACVYARLIVNASSHVSAKREA